MENNYLVIIAVISFFAFLFYKEFRRTNRARLVWRILAICCITAALTFLFFPMKYKALKNKETGQLHLLTTGTDLSALKKQVYYTTDSSVLRNSRLKNLKYIPDLAYYLQQHEDIQRVSIYGYGLEPEVLKVIKGYNKEFHAASLPSGIISCSWPGDLTQAKLFQVQGTYHNTSGEKVKIILEGLGSKLDSAAVAGNATQSFSLITQPRQLGKALYKLTVLRGTDTVQQEQIPFLVNPSPKIKLLVLSSFPDFEYKFLKNWLFEQNYQVVFRTRISKDKFSTDQLNAPGLSAENLNTTMLSKFDVVIADDEELAALNPAASVSLKSAISQGLGLLVRLNDVKTLSGPARPFKLYTAGDSTAKFFTPVLSGQTISLKKLPAGQDLYIRPDAAEQQLVKDQNGKVIISTRLSGNGKITGSVISATYHWIMEGNTMDYSRFWSEIISNTIRKEERRHSWSTVPALPVKGNETQFIYQSATTVLPIISLANEQLNMIKNTTLPGVSGGTFWPQQTGWNELKIGKYPLEYLYVYTKADWKDVKHYKTLLENKAYFENKVLKPSNDQVESETIEKDVSKWWFFGLFLIAAGFIWFETKLL